MGFYDLSKYERTQLVNLINSEIHSDLLKNETGQITLYFGDEDTYIRKTAYLSVGKLYHAHHKLGEIILGVLDDFINHESSKVRQTAVNAAGEIGMKEFYKTKHFFDQGLFDEHHSVRNAVIGSLKKMGKYNPKPVLEWAKGYLHHKDKEVRREICHGIELRGRTHPQDILPLLKELQNDPTSRVRNTLIHVLGQIAYKKGCLEVVVNELSKWDNKELVEKALDEIVDVHDRYKKFAALTQQQAITFIDTNFKR